MLQGSTMASMITRGWLMSAWVRKTELTLRAAVHYFEPPPGSCNAVHFPLTRSPISPFPLAQFCTRFIPSQIIPSTIPYNSFEGKCTVMDDAYCSTVTWEPQRTICTARSICKSLAAQHSPASSPTLCTLTGLCGGPGDAAAACKACTARAARMMAAWPGRDVCGAASKAGARAGVGVQTGVGVGEQEYCIGMVSALQNAVDDCKDIKVRVVVDRGPCIGFDQSLTAFGLGSSAWMLMHSSCTVWHVLRS